MQSLRCVGSYPSLLISFVSAPKPAKLKFKRFNSSHFISSLVVYILSKSASDGSNKKDEHKDVRHHLRSDNGIKGCTQLINGLASVYSKPTFWCSTKVDVNGYHVRGPWDDKGKNVGFCDDSCPKVLPRFFF